jgi:multidrug efflux pump subunit AcrA (membrane-fusion protein)
MAPFEVEEMRRRTVSQAIRRPVSAADRSTIIVVLLVAAAVIGAVIAYYFWSQHEAAMEARRVHAVAPRPAAVYRWFDAPGSAVVAGSTTLAFAAAGSVADVLPPGSHYAAGEIIAKLQGAAAHESDVNRARSRVAYNQQIRDSMKAANNLTEMRKAEIAIVEKQAKLDEAEAALDRLVIRALEAGEVVEVLIKRGEKAEANVPALRVRSGQIHGEFILAAKDAEAAAHLGFCRVQIVGVTSAAGTGTRPAAADGGAAAGTPDTGPRFADCRITAPPQPPNNRLEVELPPSAGILLGQPLLLARVRYDGVFPVPRSAVVRVGDTDRIFGVGPGNVAQARAITIADADPDEVVLSQGVDVGDHVIVDPPADLRDGTPLSVMP